MKLYAQLYIPQPDEELVIDILFVKDHASWGMFIKRSGKTLPIGFRCKRFPYAPNKYSLFEKYVWATYSALSSIGFSISNKRIHIRTPAPILGCVMNLYQAFPLKTRYSTRNGNYNSYCRILLLSPVPRYLL